MSKRHTFCVSLADLRECGPGDYVEYDVDGGEASHFGTRGRGMTSASHEVLEEIRLTCMRMEKKVIAALNGRYHHVREEFTLKREEIEDSIEKLKDIVWMRYDSLTTQYEVSPK